MRCFVQTEGDSSCRWIFTECTEKAFLRHPVRSAVRHGDVVHVLEQSFVPATEFGMVVDVDVGARTPSASWKKIRTGSRRDRVSHHDATGRAEFEAVTPRRNWSATSSFPLRTDGPAWIGSLDGQHWGKSQQKPDVRFLWCVRTSMTSSRANRKRPNRVIRETRWKQKMKASLKAANGGWLTQGGRKQAPSALFRRRHRPPGRRCGSGRKAEPMMFFFGRDAERVLDTLGCTHAGGDLDHLVKVRARQI